MRRRRQRNPLLMKIIIISIVVHLIALPLLAHYGAFKNIQKRFADITAITLPAPAPPEKQEPKKVVKRQAPVPQTHKRSSAGAPHHSATKVASSGGPRVMSSGPGTGGGGGGDNGFSVPGGDEDTGKMAPDVVKPAEPVKPVEPVKPEPVKPEPVKPEPVKPVEPVKPAPVKPAEPMKTMEPVKKAPVFTQAEPAVPLNNEPQPTIPDDLRSEALDKMCVVEFTVSPEGTPVNVRIIQSAGNDELDRLALDAAKHWKFKPATRDGEPIQDVVRLHIEFQVS